MESACDVCGSVYILPSTVVVMMITMMMMTTMMVMMVMMVVMMLVTIEYTFARKTVESVLIPTCPIESYTPR